jgi:hypothetical protein
MGLNLTDTSNNHSRGHLRQLRDPIVDSTLDDTYQNIHYDDTVDLEPGDCEPNVLAGVYQRDSVYVPSKSQ